MCKFVKKKYLKPSYQPSTSIYYFHWVFILHFENCLKDRCIRINIQMWKFYWVPGILILALLLFLSNFAMYIHTCRYSMCLCYMIQWIHLNKILVNVGIMWIKRSAKSGSCAKNIFSRANIQKKTHNNEIYKVNKEREFFNKWLSIELPKILRLLRG